LSDTDLSAMAVYLKTLGEGAGSGAAVESTEPGPPATAAGPGVKLYVDHCAACHGERGEGVPGAYPSLAGNRAVTMAMSANLVRIVLEGGFAPSTAAHPRPYGMPPFAQTLSNEDVASLLTHLRGSWGNRAAAVSPVEVNRYRGSGAR
ncbi:MAG: cytochrome c, partial [Pseudomonadota bacterium]|nr:cytochrome c [Pseudomonadota bacterium]